MAMLGEEQGGQGSAASGRSGGAGVAAGAEATPAGSPAQNALESVLPIPGGLLKGLFGR
jgi:hypothetical protein